MPGYNNYTDYATIDEDAYIASNGPINKMKGGVATPFPQKLHKLLEDGTHADIISWAPNGRCFLIHQPKLFVQVVLPHFFNATKKTSFTRQLNLYGFVRLLSNGPDKGGYYHEKFLRSKSKLCKLIKRIPLKGSKHSLCQDSQQEPKFYSMPYLPDFDSASFDKSSASLPAFTPTLRSRSSEKTCEITSSLHLDRLERNNNEGSKNCDCSTRIESFGINDHTISSRRLSLPVFDKNAIYDRTEFISSKASLMKDPGSVAASVAGFDYETSCFISRFF